jgi:hypothetical protein
MADMPQRHDKQPLPKESIQRGYQVVLDQCARLLSFTCSLPIDTDSDVPERQTALAIDDLILFSLHARRLISDTQMTELALKVSVPTLRVADLGDTYEFPSDGGSVAITRLMNIIIHHDQLEVFRDSLDVYVGLSTTRRPIDEIMSQERQRFPAKLLVKSKESRTVLVDLSEFMSTFLKDVFEPLVEHCTTKRIYLQKSVFGD